jgi:hypothetical protein
MGMEVQRFRRVLAAAVVVGGTALVATAVSAATASASAKALTVTCTTLSGNLTDTPITFDLAGCTGNTGGKGTAQGTTITWANGQTTYLSTKAFPLPTDKAKRGNCGNLSDKYPITDGVGGDSTGSIKVGGSVTAKVCVENEAPDPWSLAPGSVLTLR